MITVIKKTQSAAARSRVVYHLSHHRVVITEIKLVAYAYLAGRLYKHIPQLVFSIKLTQQRHLDFSTGLLLVAIQTGRKHLRIIKHEYVPVNKIIDYILEHTVFDLTRSTVHHHHASLVAMFRSMLCDQFLRKLEPKL